MTVRQSWEETGLVMLLDHSASLVAQRVGRDVMLHEVHSATGHWRITPPRGHHIVAVALRRPFGHVTSDGETLWIWKGRALGSQELEGVDLIAAARQAPGIGASKADRIADDVRACARLPQGAIQPVAFLRTQVPTGYCHLAEEPRWPTMIFGCTGRRLVVAQLDHFRRFDREQFSVFRDVLVSPMTAVGGADIHSESEILAVSFGPQVAAIARGPTGGLMIGEPVAVEEAFDAGWPIRVPIDVPEPTHGIALIHRVGDSHVLDHGDAFDLAFAVAGKTEIVLGGTRPVCSSMRADSAEDMIRMPRHEGDRLVGVTARMEAIVQRANRLEARRLEGSTLLVEANAPLAEIACDRGGIVYRVEGEEELRSLYL